MSLLSHETVSRAATDAFVEAIRRETDPWRQARLLAFVRKRREHEELRKLAEELVHQPETYWGALEILTDPTPKPPKEGPLWIEPVSDVCLVRIPPGRGRKVNPDSGVAKGTSLAFESFQEFWLGRHPLTNGEFYRSLSSSSKQDRIRKLKAISNLPVGRVTWDDAEMNYCQWLRDQTGLKFQLPTASEWEFACCSGSTEKCCFGNNFAMLDEYGWHKNNSSGTPHSVGIKKPNAWGLCDMHGNVWEWCADRNGETFANRGGSWTSEEDRCEVGRKGGNMRIEANWFIGFRIAMNDVPIQNRLSVPKRVEDFVSRQDSRDTNRDLFRHFTVVVANDEPVMITLFKQLLRNMGFSKVRFAYSGAEAFELIKREAPGVDLILMDDLMGENIRGFDWANIIASNVQQRMGIIILSGGAYAERVQFCLSGLSDQYVFSDFFNLPIDMYSLMESLYRACLTLALSDAASRSD